MKKKSTKRVSNKKIEKIGAYMQNSISKIFRGKKDEYLTAYVRVHWQDIVGRHIASKVALVNILNKELLLYTSIPAWANELQCFEEEIVSKVNLFAGKNIAKEIRFVSFPPDYKPLKTDDSADNNETLKSNFELQELTTKEKKEIKESVSKIEDEELRSVLERFGSVVRQKQNYRRDNLIKCKICGKFTGSEVCEQCRLDMRRKLKLKVVKLLSDLPYLSFAEAVKEIPEITPYEFNKIRIEMVQRLAKKINGKDGVTMQSKILTMLHKSIPPEYLTDESVMATLRELRFDLAVRPESEKKKIKKYIIKNARK